MQPWTNVNVETNNKISAPKIMESFYSYCFYSTILFSKLEHIGSPINTTRLIFNRLECDVDIFSLQGCDLPSIII